MSKILFISTLDLYGKHGYGGRECARRNYEALVHWFGVQNTTIFDLSENDRKNGFIFFKKINEKFNWIFGRYFLLKRKCEKLLFHQLTDKQIVWIDNSMYGRLAKLIRRKFPHIIVISFFHNIERDFAYAEPSKYKILQLPRIIVISRNEAWTCKYSNAVIVLNQRDKERIISLYHRCTEAVIPISLPDKQGSIPFENHPINRPPTALFLGSNFFANTHGLRWFIERVLPFTNMRLRVIGKDMDKADLPSSEKMEIFGYVENLEEFMLLADFMIFPIFLGGGMKVKTCEALMYGKNIIGTKEAFQGYEIDTKKVGVQCETAEEFIKAINNFVVHFTSKFNAYSRNAYLEHYSNDKVFETFGKLFKELGVL